MHIHILGIGGTFMCGIAVIAKQMGFQVTGSDEQIYPPMSTQLASLGIQVTSGYDPAHLAALKPDHIIVGNAMSRGNPMVEYMLERRLSFSSAPQWLAENVLHDKWVLAVSGTHGKTTTTSMLAWILDYNGLPTGFLVGGIPTNFNFSARYSQVPFFVIEADEYDSAFFDKRPKFLHFWPKTLIVNSLEFDHADIYDNLEAIKKQFQYLLRTVTADGLIISPSHEANIKDVLKRGCWSPVQDFGGENAIWHANQLNADGSHFEVYYHHHHVGTVQWNMLGEHNIHNALAAIAAANHAGVSPQSAIAALNQFQGVKRRLELIGQVHGVSVYDDFAHHPTAITATLNALRAKVGRARIIALVEFASYTMRVGYHREHLAEAFKQADYVLFLKPELDWHIEELISELSMPAHVHQTVDGIIQDVLQQIQANDQILIMSNRGFGGIHQKLLQALRQTEIVERGSSIFG